MMLVDHVKVSSRFQRSIRIDTDIGDQEIIESFICPQSSVDVLLNMAKGFEQAGEAAFTWTGPYGSGKSSLVVALNALLGKDQNLRKITEKNLQKDDAKVIKKAFGVTGKTGWAFAPLVGHKGSPEKLMIEAIQSIKGAGKPKAKEGVFEYIKRVGAKEECGLFIVIDEMGKFLEASAEGEYDIYFFQELAELAARSKGKIVVLGILHQAFAEYARRLSRDMRDEWSKIQGRYVDMPLNVAGEELIDIISRAILSTEKPNKVTPLARSVAKHISNWRPVNADVLADSLTMCWPLHPATAALLGPVSRRRFGQNQRSVFGFLNSSEPSGFQDFLKNTKAGSKELFSPARLWDYLRSNLEPSIMASPDGHRWSLAVDALARAEANGGDLNTQNVIKTVAMMDMFQERSGLVPEKSLLLQCLPDMNAQALDKALSELETWSILLFKKHKKAYSLYEGSDFDIDASIETAFDHVPELDFDRLKKAARFQPVVAKRHYHDTGALRWMNVDLVPAEQAIATAESFEPVNGAMGLLMVVLGSESDSAQSLGRLCKKVSEANKNWPIIASVAGNSWMIRSHAREVQALEWIRTSNPALGGDTVARREVDTRLASMRNRLEENLTETLSSAKWYIDGGSPTLLSFKALHALASEKADQLYEHSPKVNSELANRIKPSSNSNAGLKVLLKAMVENQGQERLGIEGYPAEGGLYETLISNSGLYDGKNFKEPVAKNDSCRLLPLWKKTDKYFKSKDRAIDLTELYEIWSKPPFGVKEGLLPFFAVAYISTRIHDYAAYLEGVYRPSIDDLFIDYLMKSPKDIALRQMNFSDVGQKILAGVCDILNEIAPDQETLSETSEPLDIARRLVGTVISLPGWVLRTQSLSKNTIRLRELVKNASDPNKVLFDDLPHLFKEYEDNLNKGDVQPIIAEVKESLKELVAAYPAMLQDLSKTLHNELQIDKDGAAGLKELNDRAKNIMQISGDFTLDAFAARLTSYKGEKHDIEGIASLAAGKPARDWIDLDVNKAMLRIAELAHKFNHTETYGRVHNREDYRQAVAFMVGLDGKPKTYVHEFTVKRTAQKDIQEIESRIKNALNGHFEEGSDLLLAALANIGAEILERTKPEEDTPKKATA